MNIPHSISYKFITFGGVPLANKTFSPSASNRQSEHRSYVEKRNLSVITIATLSDIIIYEMDMFTAFFVCFISSCKNIYVKGRRSCE